jgi:hypothetical protein
MWRPKRPEIPLVDAEAAHRADPRTFSIPRRAVREALQPADLVKLLFVVDSPAQRITVERMWVEVLEVTDGRYRGRLDNEPLHLPHLHPGDPVEFGPEHVAARHADPGDPLYSDPALFAVVSRQVWDKDVWPRRVERRVIPDPSFSGWFVYVGTETPTELEDANNFMPVSAGELFDRFRVLDSALEGPVGSELRWSDTDAEFQAVT